MRGGLNEVPILRGGRRMSKIGLIETERSGFGYLHTVWIAEHEGFLTKNLDTARVMSMNAIILHKLGVKRKDRKNKNGVYETKFVGFEDADALEGEQDA